MEFKGIMMSEINQRERQVLYDITYKWHLKGAELLKTENRVEVTRCWEEGDLENLSKGNNLKIL